MIEERDEGPQLTDPSGRIPFLVPFIPLAVLIVAFVFLVATKALYRSEDTAAAGPPPNFAISRALANRLKPLVHGHIAALVNTFQVVSIDVVTGGLDRPKAFWKEFGVKHLLFYTDSKTAVFKTLKQEGKVLEWPTPILIGKGGCEIDTMAGPAEWDSSDRLALVSAIRG